MFHLHGSLNFVQDRQTDRQTETSRLDRQIGGQKQDEKENYAKEKNNNPSRGAKLVVRWILDLGSDPSEGIHVTERLKGDV